MNKRYRPDPGKPLLPSKTRNLDIDVAVGMLMDGNMLVSGAVIEGLNAGTRLSSLAPRTHVEEIIRSVMDMPTDSAETTLRSVREAVANASRIKPGKLSASAHADLMDDLQILVAFRLVMGEQALDGSNLSELGFVIHPDDKQPYDKRGMLTPELAEALEILNPVETATPPARLLN